jgi:hypothetical protein
VGGQVGFLRSTTMRKAKCKKYTLPEGVSFHRDICGASLPGYVEIPGTLSNGQCCYQLIGYVTIDTTEASYTITPCKVEACQ